MLNYYVFIIVNKTGPLVQVSTREDDLDHPLFVSIKCDFWNFKLLLKIEDKVLVFLRALSDSVHPRGRRVDHEKKEKNRYIQRPVVEQLTHCGYRFLR